MNETRETGEPIVCGFHEKKKEKKSNARSGRHMEPSKICRILFCIESYKPPNGSQGKQFSNPVSKAASPHTEI